MMPLAPQLSVPHIGQMSASPIIRDTMKASAKPKLSFSIDSIVGKRKAFESDREIEGSLTEAELLAKSIKRHLTENISDLNSDRRSNSSPNSVGPRSPDLASHHRQSVSPVSNGSLSAHQTENVSPLRSPSPLSLVTSAQSAAQNGLPMGAQFLNRQPLPHPASLPNMHQQAPGQMPQVAPLGHPNHPMMVAAAAAAAAASSAHQFPAMSSEYQQAAAFYPWFLRASPFGGRFPGMPFDSPLSPFLLPPFRKPKRIRTAFSPGQLLKLEQAFEKNHYVVGNERKQLANHLGLSETQVKVWFQNRRTKHKRQKQEDEESGSGSMTNGENGGGHKDYSDDEEEIDLEEDEESTSDQEHEHGAAANALKFANMHHLWYQSMSAGLGVHDTTPVTSANST